MQRTWFVAVLTAATMITLVPSGEALLGHWMGVREQIVVMPGHPVDTTVVNCEHCILTWEANGPATLRLLCLDGSQDRTFHFPQLPFLMPGCVAESTLSVGIRGVESSATYRADAVPGTLTCVENPVDPRQMCVSNEAWCELMC